MIQQRLQPTSANVSYNAGGSFLELDQSAPGNERVVQQRVQPTSANVSYNVGRSFLELDQSAPGNERVVDQRSPKSANISYNTAGMIGMPHQKSEAVTEIRNLKSANLQLSNEGKLLDLAAGRNAKDFSQITTHEHDRDIVKGTYRFDYPKQSSVVPAKESSAFQAITRSQRESENSMLSSVKSMDVPTISVTQPPKQSTRRPTRSTQPLGRAYDSVGNEAVDDFLADLSPADDSIRQPGTPYDSTTTVRSAQSEAMQLKTLEQYVAEYLLFRREI